MRVSSLLALVFAGCGPASLSVAADKAVALVNSESVAITATVSPPHETLVVFSVNQSSGGTLTATNVRSNAMGVATTLLTSSAPGPVEVSAKAQVGDATPSGFATVNFTSGIKLRFMTSPSNTMSQNLLRPVPQVAIEQNGAVVTSSSASVTVFVTPGTCSGLDPTSLDTVSAAQGIASFYGLKMSAPGTRCTLTAMGNGYDQGTSAPFDVQ